MTRAAPHGITLGGLVAVAIAFLPSPSFASDAALAAAISREADRSRAIVGVSALHVETGRRFSLRGGRRFHMASVYKLPMAMQYLRLVDRGQAALGDSISLEPSDARPGEGKWPAGAAVRGRWMTSARLLRFAIQDSDNTAADVLLRVGGGPKATTARLRELGIHDIDVSRNEARMMAAWNGVKELPAESSWTRIVLDSLTNLVSSSEREESRQRFGQDSRDTATPDALVDLLAKLVRKEALSPQSTEWLLDVMAGTRTGRDRLPGKLPRKTWVAHKTGTMGDIINDVGVIALPEGRHLAIAVFCEQGRPRRSERAIALIARALYDEFALRK